MFLLRDKLITQGEKRETSTKTCNETMLRDKLRVFVPRISPPLGREAAERGMKSREVDLSRLKGLINKKDFSDSLTGSTQLIKGTMSRLLMLWYKNTSKYNKWNINKADYVSSDKDGSQKQWPIFSRRPSFLLYPFKPFTCCYNAHQACIIRQQLLLAAP